MKLLSCMISLFLIFLSFSVPVSAVNYLLNGGQESKIGYRMVQKIAPSPNTKKLILTYVLPISFSSPTYKQEVLECDFHFSHPPEKKTRSRDKRGNDLLEATWIAPLKQIKSTLNLTVKNSVELKPIESTAQFPVKEFKDSLQIYLQSTELVCSDNVKILKKGREVTSTSKTQFDAVQRIITWVINYMDYVLTPERKDALYAFETGKGNCQNYSHLSAALLRSVGIPVRIVNGITLNKPYNIQSGKRTLIMKMAQGRHSWIEIFFPDLGWIPFDAQNSQMFVSNRFIRVEVGRDNNETKKDGLIKWTMKAGTTNRPVFIETIDAEFFEDTIRIVGQKTSYGPRELLLTPKVQTRFSKTPLKEFPTPAKIPKRDLNDLEFLKAYEFGNLSFPEGVDFFKTRGPVQNNPDGSVEMKKNFIKETAEYVTTQGRKYAQSFILDKPLQLLSAELVLSPFSEKGQLWIELYKDDKKNPGELVSTSDIVHLAKDRFSPGYEWRRFTFVEKPLLSPGRYWLALGFTGSPIVNWFYTYGKPTGPADGTRYTTIFDTAWSRCLPFEFNYKIHGLSGS